jgi:hypothetical protein
MGICWEYHGILYGNIMGFFMGCNLL